MNTRPERRFLAPVELYPLTFDAAAYSARWADERTRYWDEELSNYIQVGFLRREGTILLRIEATGETFAADLTAVAGAAREASKALRGQASAYDQAPRSAAFKL